MPKNPEEKWPSESAETIDWERFSPILGFTPWVDTQVKEPYEVIDWQSLQRPMTEPWDEEAEAEAVEDIDWRNFRKSVTSQKSEEENR